MTVLSGGRYDSLISEFGADLPATGFGLNIDDLARAKLSRGEISAPPAPEYLLFGEDGYETEALQLFREWTNAGKTCEHSVCADFAAAKKYAEAHGIRKMIKIGKNGQEEVTV